MLDGVTAEPAAEELWDVGKETDLSVCAWLRIDWIICITLNVDAVDENVEVPKVESGPEFEWLSVVAVLDPDWKIFKPHSDFTFIAIINPHSWDYSNLK